MSDESKEKATLQNLSKGPLRISNYHKENDPLCSLLLETLK